MAESSKCPQCGAVMEVKTLGQMHDKVMACSYCGYIVDVPDDFQDARTYDEVAPDGTRRKVTVARKRSDFQSGSEPQQTYNPSYEETKQTITDRPGAVHTKTVVTTSVKHFNNQADSAKFKETVRSMVEKGGPIYFNSQEDLDVFKNMLPPDLQAKFKGVVGGPGNIKTTSFEKSFTISDPAAAKKLLDQMSDTGDSKADAQLLKEIMDMAPGQNKTSVQFKVNPQVTVTTSGSNILKWIVIGALILLGIKIAFALLK